MKLLTAVSEAWGWTGIRPREIVAQNSFGNLLIKDERGMYWRICPEDLLCSLIADTAPQFAPLREDPEFQADWEMTRLTAEARAILGEPGEGRCFCLKVPAVLGGDYEIANIGQISLIELIGFSGDVAQQIDDLPDGTPVEFKIID